MLQALWRLGGAVIRVGRVNVKSKTLALIPCMQIGDPSQQAHCSGPRQVRTRRGALAEGVGDPPGPSCPVLSQGSVATAQDSDSPACAKFPVPPPTGHTHLGHPNCLEFPTKGKWGGGFP